MCFCKTNIHIHNFINYNDWLPVTAVRKSNSGERVTSVFQQKLIKRLLKCLSVNSAVNSAVQFNHISKTIEVIIKLHIEMYLSPTLVVQKSTLKYS